jgi:tape measure domain-containing protein
MGKTIQSYVLGVQIVVDSKKSLADLKAIDTEVAKNATGFQKLGAEIVKGSKDSAKGLQSVAETATQVVKNVAGVDKSLASAHKTAAKKSTFVLDTKGATQELSGIGKTYDKLKKDFKEGLKLGITQSLSGSGGLLGTIAGGNPITGLLSSAISGLTSVVTDSIKKGFEFRDQWDKASITLTTITGDAKQAKGQLESLFDLAVKRDYQFQDLVTVDERLQNIGFSAKESTEMIRGMTNAAAAIGGGIENLDKISSIFERMKDGDEVAGKALKTLEGMGLKVFPMLAEATGYSEKKLHEFAKSGRLNQDTVRNILVQGWNRQYGNLAEDRAKASLSAQSNASDQIKAKLAATALGPTNEMLVKRYAQFNDFLGGNVGQGLANSISAQSTFVVGAVDKMLDSLIGAAQDYLPKIEATGAQVGESFKSGIGGKLVDGYLRYTPGGMITRGGMNLATGKPLTQGTLFEKWGNNGTPHFAQGLQFLQSQQGKGTKQLSGEIEGIIEEASKETGVPVDLIKAMMHQESGGRIHAISNKGARGPMQLMPGTARRYGVKNVFDPRQNIMGGARYMHDLLDMFHGNVPLALAGYNAGEGAVIKYGGKIPPYAETQNYVRSIMTRYGQGGSIPVTGSHASGNSPVSIVEMYRSLSAEEKKTVQGFEELRKATMDKLAWAYSERDKLMSQNPSGLSDQYQWAAQKKQNSTLINKLGSDLQVVNRDEQGFVQSSYAVHRAQRIANATPVYVVNYGGTGEAGKSEDKSAELISSLTDKFLGRGVALDAVDTSASIITGAMTKSLQSFIQNTDELGLAVEQYGVESKKAWDDTEVKNFHKSVVDALDLSSAISGIGSLLPQQQVGKKRGFFGKLLGAAAPFLNFIPGVGPIASRLASIGSNALGGNWQGALTGVLGIPKVDKFLSSVGKPQKRAFGGPVRRGQTYIVGDGGREEVFEADHNGWIHPSVEAFSRSRPAYNPAMFLPGEFGDGGSYGGRRGGGSLNARLIELLERSHALHDEHRAAIARHTSALERFESMPAHEVVRTGLPRAMAQDAGLIDDMGRRLRLA